MLSDSGWVGQAFRDCAIIILITGAGGAFGAVLRDSGIADALGGGAGALEFGVVGPLLIAAAIKTAQGSSTVAIITTASLVAPLLPALGLDSETGKALAVVAIGAGAMAVSHVNDSFFWVVTRLTGLSLTQGLKLHSAGSALQALVAAMALATLQLATNTG
jgi:GntP family gluconate:H+ symporter